jgi:hypothetical protein
LRPASAHLSRPSWRPASPGKLNPAGRMRRPPALAGGRLPRRPTRVATEVPISPHLCVNSDATCCGIVEVSPPLGRRAPPGGVDFGSAGAANSLCLIYIRGAGRDRRRGHNSGRKG